MEHSKKRIIKWVYGIAVLGFLGVMIACFSAGLYSRILYILLGTAALAVPRLTAAIFRVRLTVLTECMAVGIIIGSCMLGETLGMYEKITAWDDFMHLASGFLFCAFGFSVWEIADGTGRAFSGFSFAVTAGVTWEFIEYFCDRLLHTDMQKDVLLSDVSSHFFSTGDRVERVRNITESVIGDITLGGVLDIGLYDTMNDLIIASIGAIIFLILYRMDRSRGTRVTRYFISDM